MEEEAKQKKVHPALVAHLRRAGRAGKGEAKKRSPEHYAAMVARRMEIKAAKQRVESENKVEV
jgi:hypothetical protein